MASETYLLNPYALVEFVTGRRFEWDGLSTAQALKKVAIELGLKRWEDLFTDDPSQSILTAFTSLPGDISFGSFAEAYAHYKGPPLKPNEKTLRRLLSVLIDVKELQRVGGDGRIVLPGATLRSAFPDAQLVVDNATYIDAVQGLSTTCTVLASLIAMSWCDQEGVAKRLKKALAGDMQSFAWPFLTVNRGVKDEVKTTTETYWETSNGEPLFATSTDASEQWPSLVEKAAVIWLRNVAPDEALKPADFAQFNKPVLDIQRIGADRLPEIVLRALWGTIIKQMDVAAEDVVGRLSDLAKRNGGALDRPVIAETRKKNGNDDDKNLPLVFMHCYAVLGVIDGAPRTIVMRDPYGRPSGNTADLQPLEQPLRQRARMRPLKEIARAGVIAVTENDFNALVRSVYVANR